MPILALVTEYCERPDEQVVVLFQILAAEINFGYKFQTVKYALPVSSCLLSFTYTSTLCKCSHLYGVLLLSGSYMPLGNCSLCVLLCCYGQSDYGEQ